MSGTPGLSAGVVAGYAALVAGASVWGVALKRSGEQLGLGAPPLIGEWQPRISMRIVPALLVAAAVSVFGHRISEKVSFRRLLALSFAGSAAWAVALAASDGWAALRAPVLNPLDAYRFLPDVTNSVEFVRTFILRIASFPIHVQGHPPGLVLLLKAMEGAGPWAVAGLYIAAGAAIAPAVLVAGRTVCGERFSRAAAPWLVIAPYAVWLATSADALYASVAAWGIALIVSAGSGERIKPFCGGLLFGFAGFLTYGAAGLLLIPAAAAFRRRRFKPLLMGAAGAVAVAVGFAGFGFWWLDGLVATRIRYFEGLGGLRPYRYFVIANLAVLAIACGPAALRALPALRSRVGGGAAGWLVIPALVAVAAADLIGLTKGEVERIWLLFFPWIVVGAGVIHAGRRWWLGASAASAILVQLLIASPW